MVESLLHFKNDILGEEINAKKEVESRIKKRKIQASNNRILKKKTMSRI